LQLFINYNRYSPQKCAPSRYARVIAALERVVAVNRKRYTAV